MIDFVSYHENSWTLVPYILRPILGPIDRQGSGGNYLISVEEILNTLNLERLKLFSKLEIEQKNEQLNNSSCQCDINDFEDEMLVEAAFTVANNLSSNERSILYFISGYVARKENLKSDPNVIKLTESEFTELVSRGKLMHPPPLLYHLPQYLFSFFKLSPGKCCSKYFKKGFHLIYTTTEYSFENIHGIMQRYINCFFKAYANKEMDKILFWEFLGR